jgi:hypothetical protein
MTFVVPGGHRTVLGRRSRVVGRRSRVLSGRSGVRTGFTVLAALCLVLVAASGSAQPLLQQVDAVAARGGVTWITYRVPMVGGPRRMCCFDSAQRGADCCGQCRLEARDGVALTNADPAPSAATRIVVEPPSEMRVYARVENRSVSRVRTFSLDCDVDSGGVQVVPLANVTVDDSVAWLAGLARSTGDGSATLNSVHMPALSALALHPGTAATITLVALARNDQRPRVRSQALFWLSQRAGDKAIGAISDAIAHDPETEVKRRAVFALSQLPRDEGVPRLIEVARTNANPAVRKQAMFWLGQTKDPRAVSFFEEILFKR